jgi:hypothetical protein
MEEWVFRKKKQAVSATICDFEEVEVNVKCVE